MHGGGRFALADASPVFLFRIPGVSIPIYLDSHATTFVEPRVLEEMLPYFGEQSGNPSSPEHYHGAAARAAVDRARQTIADCLGCIEARDILFTAGATEANNLALIGSWRASSGQKQHFITTAIEHPSVLATLDYLAAQGAQVTRVGVDAWGRVNPDALRQALRPDTFMVSVMAANNEIGTLQPLAEIGQLCREAGVLFHCDAAQAVGHEALEVEALQVDFLSFSAHKFYGPKGVGALYRRGTEPTIPLQPILFGGGQEMGLRSGTLNVPGIVGMAAALRIARDEMEQENRRLDKLAAAIFARLQQAFPAIRRNGSPQHRLARNLSLTLPGVEAAALIQLLKDRVSFSAGSACATAKPEPSHVLKAIGLSDEECYQTIRLGLGRAVQDAGVAELLCAGIAAAPVFLD
jgi:cysteine desulfurase